LRVEEGAADTERRRALVALASLLLAMLLGQLDMNVVATALPEIVGGLGGVRYLAWVTTAYVLAVSVTTPLYGKLGDLYGRKRLFLSAIAVFLAGSVLCGAAQSMGQLVAFRALQGVGGGGLVVSAIAIYAGLFGALFVVSSVAGPLLGGVLADSLGWRWVFFVNLPLGLLAFAFAAFALRSSGSSAASPEGGGGGKPRVDYLGSALLAALAVCVVLLTTWGGARYAWGSPVVVALGAGSAVLLLAFLLVERSVPEPIVPPRLFRGRTFSVSVAVTFLGGFSLFGGVFFVPLFLQYVEGANATGSGLLLLPLMAAIAAVSLLAGPLVVRLGGLRWFGASAMGSSALGLWLFSALGPEAGRALPGACMVLVGAGFGLWMYVYALAVQNTSPPRDIGAAVSTLTFARQVGGAIGASVFGAIFASRLASLLPEGYSRITTTGGSLTPEAVRELPAALRRAVVEGYADALSAVFVVAALVLALGLLLAPFLGEVPLRGSPGEDGNAAAGSPGTEDPAGGSASAR
jgi:EmrB/QacA subfamily drug resistance transporter